MNTKTVTIADLKPHPNNPNTHPPAQIAALAESLDEFDQVKNIVVWNGTILAGHALVDAAIKSGRLTLEAVDVSHWPEEKATPYMLADIRLPEMAIVDDSIMAEALRFVEEPVTIPGFDEDFLEGLDAIEVNDPMGEWGGMPEFKQEDKTSFQSIHIHFKDRNAVKNFAELIGQKITDKTRSLWYPQAEIERYANKEYTNES